MEPIQATEPSLPELSEAVSACEPSAEKLLAVLDELVAFGDSLGLGDLLRHLQAARRRLAEDHFNLVVLGEFKRGKSTLVNALLQRELMPAGVLPLTSVVTMLTGGRRDRLLVRFSDGREEERAVGELRRYVTEADNPSNKLGVELARLEVEHELLNAGLDLVDTPGVGSIHAHNTEVARGFLPQVDAAMCVLDAAQPFSEAERELMRELAQRVPHLLLIVNKIDQLEAEDRDAALEFIQRAASELLGTAAWELFAVSARDGEGMAALRRRLQKLAAEERAGTLLRSVANIAAAAAADIARTARLEAHATELPVDELRRRTEVFQARIAELRVASSEATMLLDRGVERALRELVDTPLKAHAGTEAGRLRAALHARSDELRALSPRQLSAELGRWIDATIQDEFAGLVRQFEATLVEQLADLQRSYAARVQRIFDDVQAVAADVFDAGGGAALPQVGLRDPSRFTFKLKDPEHALDMIAGQLRTMVPGPLGRRLVRNDAEQHLQAMTDRHAGRLRSELVERATTATREYSRELTAAVESAIAAITVALDRAASQHRQSKADTRARLDELARIVERCEPVAAQLHG